MKLLVILPRFPYPIEKGDKLRAYHQLRILSKYHQIHLIALSHTKVSADDFEKIKPCCSSIEVVRLSWPGVAWNLVKAYFTGLPFQVGYYFSAKAYKTVEKAIRKFEPEHIYCQLLRTAEYGTGHRIINTLDYQDVFSKGIERRIPGVKGLKKWLFSLEHKRLLKYENLVFDRFTNKTIISVPDRECIPHPGREEILIVPNGVDHAFFRPVKMEKTHELVFTGNMGYPPNINCAEYIVKEILPLVHEKIPGVRVVIAGASPHAKVRALASEFVTVTGWVEDIRPSYAGAKVFLAPMQLGTGLQNKLLEAMSMKLPCITSSLCNTALKAAPGTEILIGDDAGKVAMHVINLLQDQELNDKIAAAGYDFVHRNFSWEGATRNLLRAISE
jgi:sugar transferase (PEP-CTERM/EpsH1 system associated)